MIQEMPKELPESEIFVLVGKRRRRLLLRILRDSGGPLTLGELADRIGERELENSTDANRQEVYLSLYHNHLPRLADADVIEYGGNEGPVAPGLKFDRVVPILEEVTEADRPWSDV